MATGPNIEDFLTRQEKKILITFYGGGDSAKRPTLDSVAKKYGVTRERIKQLLVSADLAVLYVVGPYLASLEKKK